MQKSSFFKERRELINETFQNLQSLKNTIGKNSTITATIPRIDNLILAQKDYFIEDANQKGNKKISHITRQKIANYINVRQENVLKMFARTFDKYKRGLDYLNERMNISSVGLTKGIENSKNDMEGALNDKRKELENNLKNLQEDYKMSLDAMRLQEKNNDIQLRKKFTSEVERLTEHFEKIIQQKEETLSLTSSSLTKTQVELKEVTNQREAELQAVISKNDEILEAHSESMLSKLVENEEKAAQLEKEFNEVFKTHSTLGPMLDRQWREKSKKLKEEFAEEDDLYEMDIKHKKLMIEDLTKQLEEAKVTYQSQKIDLDEKIQATQKIYDKNINKIINDRPSEVEKAKQRAIAEFKAKEEKMCSMLDNIRSKINSDSEQMRKRMTDKGSVHEDKIRSLADDQKKALNEFEAQKQQILDEMEKIRVAWQEEREKIIKDTERDIIDTTNKSKSEEKYFFAKKEALLKELDRIIQENMAFEQKEKESNEYLKEIQEYDTSLRKAEADLENTMTTEMNDKIKQAVDEKMKELKSQHEKEKQDLIKKMQQLEGRAQNVNDSLIIAEKNHNQNEHRKGYKLDKRGSASVSTTVKEIKVLPVYDEIPSDDEDDTIVVTSVRTPNNGAIPSFATQQFLDSQIDKWREDYLNYTKNLKQEQSLALKQLEESKEEFQNAVVQINTLKKKLVEASEEYADVIKQSESKNETELKELQDVIEKKEIVISELEIQFEENERELKRRARQIEAVEDKLNRLMEHLDEAKEQIKKKIQEEYQPLIFQEKKKSDEKEDKLNELKNDLELKLEYMKNDLFVIESANAGMEETLRNETKEMIEKLENDLNQQCQRAEEEFSQRLSNIEANSQDKLAKILDDFKKEEEEKIELFEEKMKNMEEEHQREIQSINDYCINVLSENSDKKKEIARVSKVKCPRCGILQKNVKHLEKEIVQLQIQCRDAELGRENNISLYKTFKPKIPPLP